MPVRIYALAKDLEIDSKELVEICAKAGIPGKGSALASLDDDEVQRVKSYLSHKNPPPASAPAAPAAPVRPSTVGPTPRVPPVIPSLTATPAPPAPVAPPAPTPPPAPVASGPLTKPTAPKPPPAANPPSPPPSPAPVSARPDRRGSDGSPPPVRRPEAGNNPRQPIKVISGKPAPSKPPGPPPAEKVAPPVAPAASSPPSAPPTPPPAAPGNRPSTPSRRDEAPMGTGLTGKVRVLDNRRAPPPIPSGPRPGTPGPVSGPGNDAGGNAGGGPKSQRKRREPIINLTSLPDVKQPTPGPSSHAPAQRPEIRLTPELISGTKQGKKAPLEQLVQQQQEQQRTTTTPKGKGGGSAAPGTPSEKTKSRRGGHRGAAEAVPFVEEEAPPAGKKSLAGMASARADRGKSKRKAQDDDITRVLARVDEDRKGKRTLTRRRGTNTAAPRKEKIGLELPCSIRSFSEAAGVPAAQVLKTLMTMGMMLNINATIDFATAELIAAELGLDIELNSQQTLEDDLITEIEEQTDEEASLEVRPPIVTFLGHVDHGKTSLIDRLIGTRIVAREAGGITQHIRSYQVEKDGKKITFVDTPGHAAFTEMRARGANVTDIAVLVIAADDGIMPQTEEAISHIKAAEVPIVVALNKVDLQGVDLNRPLTQLTEHHLTPSEWGGDVEVVRCSALTGQGMDELLETLLTVAELHEYRANPNRPALGVCIESQQLGDKGVVAKLVVKNGTLRVGDIIVCGPAHGRVRAMYDPLTNQPIAEAPPSTPVNITGLDEAPGAGDRFHVLSDITEAREIAQNRADSSRNQSLSGNTTRVSFEHFTQMVQDGKIGQADERVRLNLIVRADTRGSLEAIEKELQKLDHPEVEIRTLQRSVGGISVADVTLASASDAVIIGFNAMPDEAARSLADERGVEIRRYDIIYKLADEIKQLVEGRLKPEERVVELGRALVKQTFQISRVGVIAGCYVIQGNIERGCRIRVNRDGRTIGDYPMESLRRVKDDVKEVQRGMECGIKLSGFNDVKQDDVLEAYRIEEVARKLE